MAKRRKSHKRRGSHKRRATAVAPARSNPPRHRRHRRNPPAFLGKLTNKIPRPVRFVFPAIGKAFVATGGVIGARKVRGLLKQQPGTLFGAAIEILVAFGGGFLLSMAHEPTGEAFATGALMAPIMSKLHDLQIPHISDSLGDDGAVVGPGSGLTLVSAYPDDRSRITGSTAGDGMGQFVTGAGGSAPASAALPAAAPTLGDSWVTGAAA